MELGEAVLAAGEGQRADSFEIFSRSLPVEWIQQALEATGTASVRRRRLPAENALWMVIGMCLLRDRSIEEVVRHLHLVLPGEDEPMRHGTVTSSAVVQARDRLGSAPLKALFEQTAAVWASESADKHRWRGLAVYGIDGTSLRIADTPQNEAAFGRPGTRKTDSPAGYPQLRMVALMVLDSHVLAGMNFGPWRSGELELAEPLLDSLPERSLTILDRGFLSYAVFHRIQTGAPERHWLTRARKNTKYKVIKKLGPGDYLAEITASRDVLRRNPELPKTMIVRVVEYKRKGFPKQILLTSMLDPKAYPRREVINLYHERWEIEIGYDEIKTHTLERQETLRSRTPERVDQEVWGLVVGYNLVRLEMERAAERAGVPPRRISYRISLLVIRDFWYSALFASPGVLPKRLAAMQEELATLVLLPRRKRSYKRAVKIKMTRYPRKR